MPSPADPHRSARLSYGPKGVVGQCVPVAQGIERRFPKPWQQTHARSDLTVREVIEKWLVIKEPVHVRRTKVRNRQLIRDYIEPRFGSMKAAKVDAELLENYYALLRTCNGVRSKDHECEPLSNSSGARSTSFSARRSTAR